MSITSYQIVSADQNGTLVTFLSTGGFSLTLNLPTAIDGNGNVLGGDDLTNFVMQYAPLNQEAIFSSLADNPQDFTTLASTTPIAFAGPVTSTGISDAQAAIASVDRVGALSAQLSAIGGSSTQSSS